MEKCSKIKSFQRVVNLTVVITNQFNSWTMIIYCDIQKIMTLENESKKLNRFSWPSWRVWHLSHVQLVILWISNKFDMLHDDVGNLFIVFKLKNIILKTLGSIKYDCFEWVELFLILEWVVNTFFGKNHSFGFLTKTCYFSSYFPYYISVRISF